MVICTCSKCYVQTTDFVLRRDQYGTFQSICVKCDHKKRNCLYAPLLCIKKLFCCGKKSGEASSDAHGQVKHAFVDM